jgi:hypothetical protein
MDTAAILIKITGLLLFLFTARSVYKHVKTKIARRKAIKELPKAAVAAKPEHSKVEHILNTFLLYAWFVFMTVLSLGMIFNN